MRLMPILLYWLTRSRPTRLITIDGQPYLERYYLFQLLGWTFYLHRFVRNDSERHLHDHPWRQAFSLVLAGEYQEERMILAGGGSTLLWDQVVRWGNSIGARDIHRIAQVEPETWTLFCHTRRIRPWGFFEPLEQGYHYEQYGGPDTREWWRSAPQGKHINREPLRR